MGRALRCPLRGATDRTTLGRAAAPTYVWACALRCFQGSPPRGRRDPGPRTRRQCQAAHDNAAPFPGTFSTGTDDRMPGLVVLTSTTNTTLPGFSGPGTKLANLFNVGGVIDRSRIDVGLWDT